MEKILVIGCSGLVGSRLIARSKEHYQVFGTYSNHAIKDQNNFKLDTRDRLAVFKLIEKIKPDCVVDAHSLTNLDYCETHPEEAWSVNVDGSRNIAEACKNFGSKFIFISTDSVFDGKKVKKYTEKDKPHPLNYYSRTKAVIEYMLSMLDMDYIVVRSSTIYGRGAISERINFVTWLIDKLRRNEQTKIVNDQKSNPTFADSLAEFILKLYEKDEIGLFHVTGKECISRYDLSIEIANMFGLNKLLITPIITAQLNQVANRPSCVNMSVEKAERATGLSALTVTEGLERFKAQIGR